MNLILIGFVCAVAFVAGIVVGICLEPKAKEWDGRTP